MAEVDDLAARYLDGELNVEETERFERSLLRPEVAQELGHELLLRELLRTVGPDRPPTDLVRELEELVAARRKGEKASEPRFSTLRSALQGMGWMFRGPGLAFSGLGDAPPGARESIQGLSSIRYALGPLSLPEGDRQPKERPRKRSLVSRLIGRSLRRLG
ncbi:MAG: hypothetical protein JW797_04095 [Bradymonadales bacterium]|nr:hypothetical protein [Bradymonadales bacterium]